MEIKLCFGLPGTGKSTFVKEHPYHIALDLGHNAFRNEEQREKFYRKAQKHTTTELGFLSRVGGSQKLYYDTYPEYFDLKEVSKVKNIEVFFAIPTVEILEVEVVPRVFKRDGDGEFPQLYAKMYKKWHSDWLNILNVWKSALGRSVVHRIDMYDRTNIDL